MKTKKNEKLKFGSFLVIIFLIIYIPSLWNYLFVASEVQTDIIRYSTIEDTINVDAYFVRDEVLLNSPFKGNCIPEVEEGKKVPANYRVATVLKDSSKELLDELSKLDVKIINQKIQDESNDNVFSEDVYKIEDEILDKIKLIIDKSNKNDFNNINKIENDINYQIIRKAKIVGNLSTNDVLINSMNEKRSELEDKISANKKEIYSPDSGIVSFCVDRYESVLSPDKIKDLTPDFLNEIVVNEVDDNNRNFEVEVGQAFAKVLVDIENYIVFSIDNESVKKLSEGEPVEFLINDINKKFEGTISYISPEIENKHIVSVKFDKNINDTISLRKVNIDLIANSFSGLKVPISSLKNIDTEEMTANIFIVKAGYKKEISVKINGMNDYFAIIDNLENFNDISLYDIFVVNTNNVQEGLIGE